MYVMTQSDIEAKPWERGDDKGGGDGGGGAEGLHHYAGLKRRGKEVPVSSQCESRSISTLSKGLLRSSVVILAAAQCSSRGQSSHGFFSDDSYPQCEI